jgi:hypothetical protein
MSKRTNALVWLAEAKLRLKWAETDAAAWPESQKRIRQALHRIGQAVAALPDEADVREGICAYCGFPESSSDCQKGHP